MICPIANAFLCTLGRLHVESSSRKPPKKLRSPDKGKTYKQLTELKMTRSFITVWQRARGKGHGDVDNLKDGCACASSQVEDVDSLLAITQDVVNCLNRGLRLEWKAFAR